MQGVDFPRRRPCVRLAVSCQVALQIESGPLFVTAGIEYHTAADLMAPVTTTAVADAPRRKTRSWKHA